MANKVVDPVEEPEIDEEEEESDEYDLEVSCSWPEHAILGVAC